MATEKERTVMSKGARMKKPFTLMVLVIVIVAVPIGLLEEDTMKKKNMSKNEKIQSKEIEEDAVRQAQAILSSPVLFGETVLVNRDGSPRKYRDYQVEDLECEAPRIVHQDGRAVGKTVNLSTLVLWFAFVNEGKSVLVAAPYQGQLDTIIDEIEFQIANAEMLGAGIARNSKGNPKIKRKPYYEIEFGNGSVVYFRPAGDRGDAFRSLHVDFLIVDEAAWIPEKAWEALRQCLNAGGGFRVYSTPNGLRGRAYFRITNSKEWRHFRWPSWMAPDWSEEREKELLDFYGGKDTPGWQHEVMGEHGQATYGAFDAGRVMRSMTEIPEYRKVRLSGEAFEDNLNEAEIRERLENILALPGGRGKYWLGGDLGYTSDPTELLLFEEMGKKVMRLVLRVHAEHVPYPIICDAIALIDRVFSPQGLGLDRGGNGLSVEQDLLTLDKYGGRRFSERLSGYNFGSSVTVGEDGSGKVVKKKMKEHMTNLINDTLDGGKLEIPENDHEVADQLCTQTYVSTERGIVYSKGGDHIVDAMRCAFMAREGDPEESSGVVFITMEDFTPLVVKIW